MLFSELSVFKDTFDLVSLLIDYISAFPRMYRFTIGEKMTNTSLELFEYIQLANRAVRDKAKRIQELEGFFVKFELLKVLLRLCNEKHSLSVKQMTNVAVLTEKIGKQINGWKKS